MQREVIMRTSEEKIYRLAINKTDPRHIFTRFNNRPVEECIGAPYLVYNSCGPLEEGDGSYPQAFPGKYNDCLFITEVVSLSEETLGLKNPPDTIKAIKKEWDKIQRTDIIIYRELIISLSGQKYVLFYIMADYPTAYGFSPEKLAPVKLYKDSLKESEKIYNSIPKEEKTNLKIVSLHFITLVPQILLINSDEKGKLIINLNKKTSPTDFLCYTMDGGCNPQKRFITQLVSIAKKENSNFILDKESHTHFAIRQTNGKIIWIDGSSHDETKSYSTSLWSDQGFYNFLKFLGLVSRRISIDLEYLQQNNLGIQISTHDEKKGEYSALFQATSDPNKFEQKDSDLYKYGFRTGMSISLPLDILLLQMARYTRFTIVTKLKEQNSEELITLQKMLKELNGEKISYSTSETASYDKLCNYFFGQKFNLSTVAEEDKEDMRDLIQAKIALEAASPEELELLRKRNEDLQEVIKQLRQQIISDRHKTLIDQYIEAVKQEAHRQIIFLTANAEKIISQAEKDLEGIQKKLDHESVLNESELRNNDSNTSSQSEMELNNLSCELRMKREILQARLQKLADMMTISTPRDSNQPCASSLHLWLKKSKSSLPLVENLNTNSSNSLSNT